MSNGLKQRIIGTIALSALGMVILSLLFDFADPQPINRQSLIPPAPEIATVDIPVAARPPGLIDRQQVTPIFDIDSSKPDSTEGGDNFGLDGSGLPSAWVLQVGSFKKRSLAQGLMNSLREREFKAFKKRVELTEGIVYRVYVGPKIDRRRAVAAKAQIDKLFATDSILLKYVP